VIRAKTTPYVRIVTLFLQMPNDMLDSGCPGQIRHLCGPAGRNAALSKVR